jgi:hypothetical protein
VQLNGPIPVSFLTSLHRAKINKNQSPRKRERPPIIQPQESSPVRSGALQQGVSRQLIDLSKEPNLVN